MKKLKGVITAMTTPFDKNGVLDIEAAEKQVDFLIEKGVNCLYPTGTTGEMYLMSAKEREILAETIVKRAAGRVTVYIHVGAMTQEDTIRLAKHANKIGADGIGVVTPSYFTVNDRAMVEYYKSVCNAVPKDFPVYAYAIPQLAHNELTPEVMEKICNICPNLVGVKYSYPDFRTLMAYLEVNGGNFSVVFGADDMFMPALCAGADGVVSGCSGPFPEPFVKIYKEYCEGNLEAARITQKKANEIIFLMKAGADMSIFKNILNWRGIPAGHMRAPLMDISKETADDLYNMMKKYITEYQ